MGSRIIVLSANLGNFDSPIEHAKQDTQVDFHTFTDEDFPPIADLPPRFQYRIPKMFGWQMKPGYDIYIWLDGTMQLTSPDSVRWLIEQLGDHEIAFFDHPWRKTIKEEVDYIEERLKTNDKYITPRYKNGLHKESLKLTGDGHLYASTVFIYKNKPFAQEALIKWWTLQSRYYSCDQITLTSALELADVVSLPGKVFKNKYLKVGSKHK